MKFKLPTLSLEPTRGSLRTFAYGFVIFLVVFVALLAIYAKSYDQKTLLNTYLFGKNISGQSREDIKALLAQKKSENKDNIIHLKYEDHQFENKLTDIGWDLDEEKTVAQLFDYGHSDDGFRNIGSSFKSVFVKKNFDIVYSLNEKLVDDWIANIDATVAEAKTEGNIIVKGSEARVIDPKAGTKVDKTKLKSELDQTFLLIISNDLYLELVEDIPHISSEQAGELVDEAIKKSSEAITLEGPASNTTMYPDTIGAMIELKAQMTKGTYFKDPEIERIYVSLNDAKVRSYLEGRANDLNIAPVDARFTISNGSVVLYQVSVVGEAIELNDATSDLVRIFEEGQEKSFELKSNSQEPSISAQNASDIERFGIKELIGKATTEFTGSPDNRLHNIQNGVKYISGALVKSGEEFSTIGKLGQIDASGGYLPELVIKEDETVPEFGGGLCQVSTTLFRSAMNAGLKISERQNHSYRVSYYEPPVGMDATIYSPRPDFRFINTTDHAILVYGYVTGYRVTFEIYGTDDGRVAELSAPEIYDITTPPETIYVDDPSLEPGEEKRLDRAHNGAKAFFYYKVRKNGGLIEDQKFMSYYVAWPAKYARGPQIEENADGTENNEESSE